MSSEQHHISELGEGDLPPQRPSSPPKQYDGSRPAKEPTGIGGSVIPHRIRELLGLTSQKGEPSTMPEASREGQEGQYPLPGSMESKEQYSRRYTEYILDNAETSELAATSLLALRKNENPKIRDYDFQREDSLVTLRAITKERHTNLEQQYHIQLENIMQLFEKYSKKANSSKIGKWASDSFGKLVSGSSGGEARTRMLEGMIIITKALREKGSAEILSQWMEEGHEGWIKEESKERPDWEHKRAWQIAAHWPGPISERPNYVQSHEVRWRLQAEWTAWRERQWEDHGQDEHLHAWEEYGQQYYPTLKEKRDKWVIEQLDTVESLVHDPETELPNKDKSIGDKTETELPGKDEGKDTDTTDHPRNPVVDANIRGIVFKRQCKFIDEYDYVQRMKENQEKPDTVINRILRLHNENREKLVSAALDKKYELDPSEHPLAPEKNPILEKEIDPIIESYMQSESVNVQSPTKRGRPKLRSVYAW